jgi:hypothetical protein
MINIFIILVGSVLLIAIVVEIRKKTVVKPTPTPPTPTPPTPTPPTPIPPTPIPPTPTPPYFPDNIIHTNSFLENATDFDLLKLTTAQLQTFFVPNHNFNIYSRKALKRIYSGYLCPTPELVSWSIPENISSLSLYKYLFMVSALTCYITIGIIPTQAQQEAIDLKGIELETQIYIFDHET